MGTIETPQNERLTGKIKWYHPEKGYGFVIGDNDREYYIHHSHIVMAGFRKLKKGELVSFEAGEENKGNIAAVNLVRLSETQGKDASSKEVQGKETEE